MQILRAFSWNFAGQEEDVKTSYKKSNGMPTAYNRSRTIAALIADYAIESVLPTCTGPAAPLKPPPHIEPQRRRLKPRIQQILRQRMLRNSNAVHRSNEQPPAATLTTISLQFLYLSDEKLR